MSIDQREISTILEIKNVIRNRGKVAIDMPIKETKIREC